MITLSFLTPKGGSGKTTIALNLAVEYCRRAMKVTIIDADDGQWTARDWGAVREQKIEDSDIPEAYRIPVVDTEGVSSIHDAMDGIDADMVVIDGPGRTGDVTGAIASLSDYIVIPVRPAFQDVWGVEPLIDLLKMRGRVEDARFVASQVAANTAIGDQVGDLLEVQGYSVPLLEHAVRFRPATYAEFLSSGKGVQEGDPHGSAAEEIDALADELVDTFEG